MEIPSAIAQSVDAMCAKDVLRWARQLTGVREGLSAEARGGVVVGCVGRLAAWSRRAGLKVDGGVGRSPTSSAGVGATE